jgi:hypothetical protein
MNANQLENGCFVILDGPFYVERPKVLFNAATSSYVMWAVMDNNARSLAMSAIATSVYEDGYD